MEKIKVGCVKKSIRGNNVSLEYYLTEEKKEGKNNLYGIQIELRNREKIESERTGIISDCKDKVEQFLEKLMKCAITPYVLLEVVDDLFE